MPDTDIAEVTQPVELAIVEDRLHFTLTSGNHRRTYAISFHKARGAAHEAQIILDERDRNGCGILEFAARKKYS